jgi:hypothetical protein
MMGTSGIQCVRMGAAVKAFLSALKARRQASSKFQSQGAFLRVRRVLAREARERNDKVRIIMDETAIEIGKAKERLDVLHFAGLRHQEKPLGYIALYSTI